MNEIIGPIIFLAFIAAITPGPLTALLLSETIKHGKKSGIIIALSPLFTDLPIMVVSIFLLAQLENLDIILGFISLFGAFYLMYLAYGSIKTSHVDLKPVSTKKSFIKGIIVNFLNPNPYIFYFSIIGPLTLKAMKENILYAPFSVVLFLGVFVTIMIGIVLSVHASKQFFNSKNYIYLIRILGVGLLIFAINFINDSLKFFGLL